jgi:hypothetical protein
MNKTFTKEEEKFLFNVIYFLSRLTTITNLPCQWIDLKHLIHDYNNKQTDFLLKKELSDLYKVNSKTTQRLIETQGK